MKALGERTVSPFDLGAGSAPVDAQCVVVVAVLHRSLLSSGNVPPLVRQLSLISATQPPFLTDYASGGNGLCPAAHYACIFRFHSGDVLASANRSPALQQDEPPGRQN